MSTERAADPLLETKVEVAQVLDAYQLLMYWDGLVEEGRQPSEGILVAMDFPPSVEKALAHINALKDKNGVNYNLKSQKLSAYVD